MTRGFFKRVKEADVYRRLTNHHLGSIFLQIPVDGVFFHVPVKKLLQLKKAKIFGAVRFSKATIPQKLLNLIF